MHSASNKLARKKIKKQEQVKQIILKRKNRRLILLAIFFILGFAIATFIFYQPKIKFPETQIITKNTEIIPIVDRNYFDIVSKEITKAQKSIDIAMFEFKFYDNDKNKVRLLLEDLIKAKQRGVAIRVLLDQSDWSKSIRKENEPTVNYLQEHGVSAKFDSPKKTLHAKLIIIDNSVIIGSTNLGFHALERNNEVSVLIKNKEIADYYKTYFETLWS